ncbi:Uu.00g056190.m01.CDS01 [Anthostomella pinea]|uniref:RNA methyltransferase n=1 Tax=Anthostomella pinea TaxID=933095 RepID=A0AAI8VS91_9PEZI|nr:Uu.00g056190.m01.CDS01 [Anthostomella pinea]
MEATSDTPSAADAAAPQTNNARNRARHNQLHSHGNYHNYYSFRAQQVPDPRLALLASHLLSKRVLDLGCNAGKLTKEVITHFSAASALGADLDPVLIAQAEAAPSPRNCTFRLQDFLVPGWVATAAEERFDIVLLLSVTKWIHLNALDAGLLALFREVHDRMLVEGGVLVVEPQEWDNYKRAVRKAPHLKPGFAMLELRPPFLEALAGVGFTLEEDIAREEGGFSRPLHVWRKGPSPG